MMILSRQPLSYKIHPKRKKFQRMITEQISKNSPERTELLNNNQKPLHTQARSKEEKYDCRVDLCQPDDGEQGECKQRKVVNFRTRKTFYDICMESRKHTARQQKNIQILAKPRLEDSCSISKDLLSKDKKIPLEAYAELFLDIEPVHSRKKYPSQDVFASHEVSRKRIVSESGSSELYVSHKKKAIIVDINQLQKIHRSAELTQDQDNNNKTLSVQNQEQGTDLQQARRTMDNKVSDQNNEVKEFRLSRRQSNQEQLRKRIQQSNIFFLKSSQINLEYPAQSKRNVPPKPSFFNESEKSSPYSTLGSGFLPRRAFQNPASMFTRLRTDKSVGLTRHRHRLAERLKGPRYQNSAFLKIQGSVASNQTSNMWMIGRKESYGPWDSGEKPTETVIAEF